MVSRLSRHARRSTVDIIAEDAQGLPVLLVEVRSTTNGGSGTLQQLRSYARALGRRPAFALTATPEWLDFYQVSEDGLSHVLRMASAQVLRFYDPEATKRRLFHGYLLALVEGWLRDVAFNWKSSEPPGIEELRRAGIADRLANGTTRSEVTLERGSLP